MAKQSLLVGKRAEELAKLKLLKLGYRFIIANFHSKFGEVDLIFLDQDQLVFVEVKARKENSLIDPLEAITASKLEKITLTAEYFMQTHPDLPRHARIDAVSIVGKGESAEIIHHQNIGQM